jgi:hypothetical protein
MFRSGRFGFPQVVLVIAIKKFTKEKHTEQLAAYWLLLKLSPLNVDVTGGKENIYLFYWDTACSK